MKTFHQLRESQEQINELSRELLRAYADKAQYKLQKLSSLSKEYMKMHDDGAMLPKVASKVIHKTVVRSNGLQLAKLKLAGSLPGYSGLKKINDIVRSREENQAFVNMHKVANIELAKKRRSLGESVVLDEVSKELSYAALLKMLAKRHRVKKILDKGVNYKRYKNNRYVTATGVYNAHKKHFQKIERGITRAAARLDPDVVVFHPLDIKYDRLDSMKILSKYMKAKRNV
jgi:hypothetical protein